MRWTGAFLWPAAAALAVGAEWAAYDWSDVRHWLPDLLAGSALIACGLVAWSRSWSAVLMAAAGFAWFTANFDTTGVSAMDWLSDHALYLHRGPLVALVLTYPRGRPRGRLDWIALLGALAVAVVTPVWRSAVASIVLAALMVVIASWSYVTAVGRERRQRLAAWNATAALAVVLIGVAVTHLVGSPLTVKEPTLLAYQISLVVLAAVLLAGLVQAPWEPRRVGDLVVELGEARSGTLRDALARALGDPTLQVGYWSPAAGAYVDAGGRALDLATATAGRSITRIDRDDGPVALLVHDPAVLNDRGSLDAVAGASRLAASNARLQAEVRLRVEELESSRLRLLEAGDESRRRLEQRLRDGAESRLEDLRGLLEQARTRASRSGETAARIERAEKQLDRTLAELRELARGLHPRALAEHGLAGALGTLASESPLEIECSVPEERFADQIEAAVYFVCAEALANVAKYAGASRASVRVRVAEGWVMAEISDDGVGGADPARGTGLAGLGDRIEALGGRLRIQSPAGLGTRITADVPFTGS